MTRSLPHELFSRQITGDAKLAKRVWRSRSSNLELSLNKTVKSEHTGALTWFDLEPVDRRYLLAGAADASIAVYDVVLPSPDQQSSTHARQHKAVFCVTKQNNKDHHKFTVTTVGWYPVDAGLFLSGSFDKTVKVWNTNSLQQLCQFNMSGKVYSLSLSPIASTHQLVAVGTEEHRVRLCDLASGGFTHTLNGHRDGVWAVAWSLVSEFQLATGSCDGQVRLWDVRRATGALHVFDQESTTRPRSKVMARKTSVARDSKNHTNFGKALVKGSTSSTSGTSSAAGVSRAVAHNGSVTYIHPTHDGLHWITAGTDSRVRAWDTQHHTNLLVNYAQTFNRAMKARQICSTEDGQLLFHPSGSVVQLFDLTSGTLINTLRGAFDTVNAMAYNPALQELYTGASDRQIMVWSPAVSRTANDDDDDDGSDKDNWSD